MGKTYNIFTVPADIEIILGFRGLRKQQCTHLYCYTHVYCYTQSYIVGIQTQGGSYGLWQYRINMHKLLVEEKA